MDRNQGKSPVISVADVNFAYDGVQALSRVDLRVMPGDFVAMVGPNGGGKTTLVKLILGILKPNSGSVRVFGQDPARHRPAIGYVPQHAVVRPSFPITVLDVVLMGLERSGFMRGLGGKDRERARDMLSLVNMAESTEKRFDALSGGQKQRVLVARALVSDPALLLFDEPTANIDPHGKVCLFDLFSALSESITIVMVSHDLISASTSITSIAAVNKHLIQRASRQLTPEMLELIYGIHDHTCPLDDYLQGVSQMFHPEAGDREEGNGHA